MFVTLEEHQKVSKQVLQVEKEMPGSFYADLPLGDRVGQMVRIWRRALAVNSQLEKQIETLYDAIAHGDDAHRRWLKEKIEYHFKRMAITIEDVEAAVKLKGT